jgi:hypothetical protein
LMGKKDSHLVDDVKKDALLLSMLHQFRRYSDCGK